MNRFILQMALCACGFTMCGVCAGASDDTAGNSGDLAKQERVGRFSAPVARPVASPAPVPAEPTAARRQTDVRRRPQIPSEADDANAPSARNSDNGAPKPEVNPVQTEGLSFHDRIVRLVTVQQTLANQITRLQTKRAALMRWDQATQERFSQAFGTTSDEMRSRVVQRLDQLIDQKMQLLAANAEQVNFERFLEQKKGQ